MATGAWSLNGRPLVFAHRGGSRLAPENTIAAFDRGTAEGADGLELDVRLSRDGEVVVCHDATIDRTCDGTGAIAEMTAGQLARVDAGHRFSPGDGTHPYRGQGVAIPTLRDVLSRYPDHRLIIEMKENTEAMARATLAAVREAGALGRVCLGSFHDEVLRWARRLEPGVATSAGSREVLASLVWATVGAMPPIRRFHAFQVPERRKRLTIVTPRFVRAAHRAGLPVQVWIVDHEDDVRRLAGWGVDAVITDRPDVAVRTIRDLRTPER